MATRRERQKPFLLPQLCKGCARCIEACAKQCIEMGIEINPEYVSMSEERLRQPGGEWDSVDPRLLRISKDLPKEGAGVSAEGILSLPGL